MPRAMWPLLKGRPKIEAILVTRTGTSPRTFDFLAETGGGTDRAKFELVLDENDCRIYERRTMYGVQLGGAYTGTISISLIRVQIPQLLFDHRLRAVGVASITPGFDGIACFRFLNRFNYGNFADSGQFGLEV